MDIFEKLEKKFREQEGSWRLCLPGDRWVTIDPERDHRIEMELALLRTQLEIEKLKILDAIRHQIARLGDIQEGI